MEWSSLDIRFYLVLGKGFLFCISVHLVLGYISALSL